MSMRQRPLEWGRRVPCKCSRMTPDCTQTTLVAVNPEPCVQGGRCARGRGLHELGQTGLTGATPGLGQNRGADDREHLPVGILLEKGPDARSSRSAAITAPVS